MGSPKFQLTNKVLQSICDKSFFLNNLRWRKPHGESCESHITAEKGTKRMTFFYVLDFEDKNASGLPKIKLNPISLTHSA